MCGGFYLSMTREEKYMKLALKEAKKALLIDEVPIGCIIVKDDKVIARSFNTREKDKLVTSHCEINAIKKASKKLNDWQLVDCELYVTLEPCPMCAGTIYQSRIKKVVYGASDIKQGALGSSFNLYDIDTLNHHSEIISGVMKEECSQIIKDFFKEKRNKNKSH